MEINAHNYEAYYLDYLEGNLSAEDTAQLLVFLESHPELKEEVEGVELINLNSDQEISFDKSALTKAINEENAEEYIIASLENKIDEDDQSELEQFLNRSSKFSKLADVYKYTILPVPSVTYQNKSSLKRRGLGVYLYPVAAAAAVLLAFVLVDPLSEGPKAEGLSASHQILRIEAKNQNQGDQGILEEKAIATTSLDNRAVRDTAISIPDRKIDIVQNNTTTAVVDHMVEIDSVAVRKDKLLENTVAKNFGTNPEVIDSSFSPEVTHHPAPDNIALVVDQDPVSVEDNNLTLKEWLVSTVKKRILRKEKGEVVDALDGNEFVTAVVEQMDEKSKRDLSYNYTTKAEITSYTISVGRFEFSRVKSRKL